MDNLISFDSDHSVARFAPDATDLERAAEQGFKSVVNFRTRDEKQDILPDDEQHLAEQAGLVYLHHPVSADTLDAGVVDQFRQKLAALPKPVLLHCASGKRAGAMVLMARAADDGLTGEGAIALGQENGLDLLEEKIGDFVRNYADRKSKGYSVDSLSPHRPTGV